jgi:hypothetical protein
MLSHSRNLFSARELETRRHRRAYRRRIIPAWTRSRLRRQRCTCELCIPWHHSGDREPYCLSGPYNRHPSDFLERPADDALGPWGARAFRLRLHARWLMTELARFQPRLAGVLGELDRLRFPYFEGIELAVDEDDLPAVAAHLASLRYRVERVRHAGRPALEAEQLERVVVLADDGVMPGITLPELEEGLARLHGKRFAQRLRPAWM